MLLVAVYAATSTATLLLPLVLVLLLLLLLFQPLLLFFCAWFRHVTCHNSLSKPILQGILEGRQRHGWQMKCWMDNIKDCSQGLSAERAGRGSLMNRPSCLPNNPIGRETEQNYFFGLHRGMGFECWFLTQVVVVVFWSLYKPFRSR